MKRFSTWMLVVVACGLHASNHASAQNSSLAQPQLLAPPAPLPAPAGQMPARRPIRLEDASWTYIPIPPPKQIRIHDTVVVRVDELTRVQSEGEIERRKDSQYDGVLADWIRLIGLKAVKPAPQRDGDPRIKGSIKQVLRAEGELETRESLAFNIACTIADIRPNGTLVLEGHKQIRVNQEYWEVSLTGICRHEDIGPDNVVLSRNIVNLRIDKRERGQVRDSYKRGWLLRWFDEWHPF